MEVPSWIAPTRHPPLEAIMESTPVRNVVLCVDDEEAIRCLLEVALEQFGYTALVACNGREALRLTAQHRADAVILDYCMPDMNGGEVALEMKRLRPDVPIILFSGSLDIPSSTLMRVNAFVAKGEGLRPLLAVLARLLQVPEKKQPAVRRFRRFPTRLSLAVTVDRAGELAMLQGVSTELSEGGIGGIVDGDLEPGECVLLTISDSRLKTTLEPRAQVRYRRDNHYGFEFSDVGPIEQANVRQFCGRLMSG
jgi:two-component system alkaline phosphatase synthesis response regulator PhoP